MSEHEVFLDGGPADMPTLWRVEDFNTQHVKVPRWSQLEHYEFSGGHRKFEGRCLPVFRWVYTTRIAE